MERTLADLKQSLFQEYPELKDFYDAETRAADFQERCRLSLRELRMTVGVSEEELAKRVGLPIEAIRSIEDGTIQDITLSLFFRIAELCKRWPVLTFELLPV